MECVMERGGVRVWNGNTCTQRDRGARIGTRHRLTCLGARTTSSGAKMRAPIFLGAHTRAHLVDVLCYALQKSKSSAPRHFKGDEEKTTSLNSTSAGVPARVSPGMVFIPRASSPRLSFPVKICVCVCLRLRV